MNLNPKMSVTKSRKTPSKTVWFCCVCFATLLVLPYAGGAQGFKVDKSALKSSIDRGANWLIDHQRSDGSWGSMAGDPGITGMVIKSLADTPRAYREQDGPFISAGVKSLLAHQQEDGGVYIPGQGLMNYKTSIAILALTALDGDRKESLYRDSVAKMRDYVSGLQCAENSSPIPFNRKTHTGSVWGDRLWQ